MFASLDLVAPRVAVLGNQVAGEARQPVVIHVSLPAFAENDHFARARKMMVRVITRLPARRYGLGDRFLEAAPLAVAQQRLEFASAPVLRVMLVDSFNSSKCLFSGCRRTGTGRFSSTMRVLHRFYSQGRNARALNAPARPTRQPPTAYRQLPFIHRFRRFTQIVNCEVPTDNRGLSSPR